MDKNKFPKFWAWGVVSLCIIIFGGVLYYSYSKLSDVFTDYSIDFLHSIGESRANQVKLFLEGKQNRVVDFSSDGFIKNNLYDIKHGLNNEETMEKLSYHLAVNKLPVDKHFYKVMALGINGVVVASTDTASVGVDLAADPVYLEGRNNPYVKNLSYDSTSSVASFILSAPVIRENEFVGVIVIKMLPDILMDIVSKNNSFSEKLETYIIDENGYLITPSKFLGGENKGVLTQKVDTENSEECLEDIKKFYKSGKKEIKEHEEKPVEFKNYRGENVLGMHAYIEEMKWCLLAEMDKTAIWEGGKRGLVATLFLFFVVTSLAVLVAGSFVAGRQNFEQR